MNGECGHSRAGLFGFFTGNQIDIHDGSNSGADGDSYGGGGYLDLNIGDFGLSLIGIAGFSDTNFVNGVLGSNANIDQSAYGGQVTASYTPQMNEQTSLDLRLFGRGVWGDIDPYTDNLGLAFSSSDVDNTRVGGTAGFTFSGIEGDMASSFYANAGIAFQDNNSEASSNSINVNYDFEETLALFSAGLTIAKNETFTFFADVTGEWGEHTESYSARAGFSLKLN